VSRDSGRPEYPFIDSRQLAARWAVPELDSGASSGSVRRCGCASAI
jgi:hypothetical protein